MKEVRSQKSGVNKVIFLLFALCLFIFAGQASAELTTKANHDHISVDFFYHGGSVSVRGISDPDVDLVIKITSPEGHQVLKQKGKIAGFLWMNVGSLNLDHVPSYYYLTSTKKVEDIINPEEREKNVIGYEALKKHVEMTPVANEDEKTKWFNEFVRFREHSNLFSETSGKITFSNENGKRNYYVLNDWPYQAQPGEYTVTAYAIKDGKVVETATSKVIVEQVGIVKSLAGMAKERGGLYGMLSIIAALGAGFGVGLVFRKGGGAH